MKERIKILYVTDGLGNGGKERQLIETIKHLDRNRFIPGLLTFSGNQHYTEKASGISEYFEIIYKNKSKLDPLISVFGTFEKYKPDIVHTFDIISALYTYLPSRFYGSRILNASIQDAGLDKGWEKKIKKMLIDLADCAVGNSKKGLAYYGAEGDVLYNFIDEGRFLPGNREEKFHAAMVATFSKYKDYDAYFNTVRILINENLIDDAYAVGAGPNFEYYKNNAVMPGDDISGRIVFTGNSQIVEEILTSISVGFLFSTEEYGEGISNSVLEYMSAGVIAIVSDIGASDEIIEDGVNGFLVNKNDVGRIKGIVKKLREDESYAENIRNNAFATVREKFSLKKNLEKLENIYLKLAGE